MTKESIFKAVCRINLSEDLEVRIIAKKDTALAASTIAMTHLNTLRKESSTFALMETTHKL